MVINIEVTCPIVFCFPSFWQVTVETQLNGFGVVSLWIPGWPSILRSRSKGNPTSLTGRSLERSTAQTSCLQNVCFYKWGTPRAGWFLLGKILLTWMMNRGTPIHGKPQMKNHIKRHSHYLSINVAGCCIATYPYSETLCEHSIPGKESETLHVKASIWVGVPTESVPHDKTTGRNLTYPPANFWRVVAPRNDYNIYIYITNKHIMIDHHIILSTTSWP